MWDRSSTQRASMARRLWAAREITSHRLYRSTSPMHSSPVCMISLKVRVEPEMRYTFSL